MKIVGIIQARMSSSRLPGKMLRSLHKRPMLDWVVEAARRAERLDDVILATSTDPSDTPLAAHADSLGLAVHRGSLDDVARRLADAAQARSADAFVRINGDSPLLDPALIDQGIALFRSGAYDLSSNVAERSFPKGQSVEVVACSTLLANLGKMEAVGDREHVTPYFYRNRENFRIINFVADNPAPTLQLSVDTAEDFARCEAILSVADSSAGQIGWEELAMIAIRLDAASDRSP